MIVYVNIKEPPASETYIVSRKSPQRERYFMRRAPRTNAAATLDRDAPGPPRGHARTERTATITFLHQLRAQPPKARYHASTFL